MNIAKPVRELATLVEAGLSPAKSFDMVRPQLTQLDETWRQRLEMIWNLSIQLGAPVGPTLTQLAANLEQQQDFAQKTTIAFATPSMTAKLISWLPLVSLGLAQLLGLNPIIAIFTNLVAFISVVFGAALMAAGHYWSKKLLNAAKPESVDPGLPADLVAVALDAGLPAQNAKNRIFSILNLDPQSQAAGEIDSSIRLANQTGAAAAKILRAVAIEIRRNQAFEDLNRITKLNVKLLLPIGVTTLPAFALLTLIPIGLSFISSTG